MRRFPTLLGFAWKVIINMYTHIYTHTHTHLYTHAFIHKCIRTKGPAAGLANLEIIENEKPVH